MVLNIRRKASVNIIMDPGIEAAVTIDMQDVHWRQALDLVAEQAGCVVSEQEGGVLKVEKPPRVYFAFENTDIQKVIDTIAKISGANIVWPVNRSAAIPTTATGSPLICTTEPSRPGSLPCSFQNE